jgi:transcription-repair coupling factor (superfamily II helicase)
MYQKILDEAILELKEQDFSDVFRDELPVVYVKDCQIETDLEIMIPDQYITNITERLNLYKELDSLETEEELVSFRNRLNDRFGNVPEQTVALIDAIRLRRLARKIGFERLVLRKGRLTCFFPENEASQYFQSPQFTAILEYIKSNPPDCRMKEEKNRLILVFRDVESIRDALTTFGGIPQPL